MAPTKRPTTAPITPPKRPRKVHITLTPDVAAYLEREEQRTGEGPSIQIRQILRMHIIRESIDNRAAS